MRPGHDGALRILLRGSVDEQADFEPIRTRIGSSDVVLDLELVMAMNSAGISRWVMFLEQLTQAAERSVTLSRCSFHGFVMPATMITSMTAGARVESIQLPYDCGCSEELGWVSSWADLDEVRTCKLCGHARSIDVAPELLEPLLGPRP